jgi:hypothetical protein
MKAGIIPKNNFFVNTYIAGSKKRLKAYDMTNQLIKATQECTLSIAFLDGVSPQTAWFKQQAATLAANPQYQAQLEGQQNLLTTEQNIKAEYMQHFQQGDDQYWTSTIRDLQAKASGHAAPDQMYQRLLAYLSLAFYSISNQLITGNDNVTARHFVDLYKLADPTNSEAWYFSAVLYARDGRSGEVESDLLKAAANGFKDKNRMLQQIEFQHLNPKPDFERIEKSMHL